MEKRDDRMPAAYVDATAVLLRLLIAAGHLPGVRQHFARVA
jgi:hypothetical protein